MLFFHYTNRYAIDGIRKTGVLKTSVVMKGFLCLTDDPFPDHHGLPDGRQITQQQAQQMGHEEIGGRFFSIDHTECRISLDIDPNDPFLHIASDVLPARILEALAITAHHPTEPNLSKADFELTKAKMRSGILANKAPTWWFYLSDVPLDQRGPLAQIRKIEIRSQMGHFVPYP